MRPDKSQEYWLAQVLQGQLLHLHFQEQEFYSQIPQDLQQGEPSHLTDEPCHSQVVPEEGDKEPESDTYARPHINSKLPYNGGCQSGTGNHFYHYNPE